MRQSAAPVTIRMHPAMPSAGVMVGVMGSGFGIAVVDVASVDWIAAPLEVVDASVVAELRVVVESCAFEMAETPVVDGWDEEVSVVG